MIANMLIFVALAQQPADFFCSDTLNGGFIERAINTAVDRAANHARVEQRKFYRAAADMMLKLADESPRASEVEFFADDEPQFVNVIEPEGDTIEETPTEPPEVERLRARVRELEAENEQLRTKCQEQSVLERYKPRPVPAKQVDEFAEPGEPQPGRSYRRGPDGKLYRIRGYPNASVASQPVPSPEIQDGVIVENQPRPRGFLLTSPPAAGGCINGRCRLRAQ